MPPAFQVVDVCDVGGSGSFDVFGRDEAGVAHRVRVTDVPVFISVGLPRAEGFFSEFAANNWRQQLDGRLMKWLRGSRECKRTNCTCQYAQMAKQRLREEEEEGEDGEKTAWVSLDWSPCVVESKARFQHAVRQVKVLEARSSMGFSAAPSQFFEFQLEHALFIRPAKRALYDMLRAPDRRWEKYAECEVFNVRADPAFQFLCNTVRLPRLDGQAQQPTESLGGGRWLAPTDADTVPFSKVRTQSREGVNAPCVVMAFDLETDFVNGTSLADRNPILCISIACRTADGVRHDRVLTWVEGEVDPPEDYCLERFPTEVEMLQAFARHVRALDPDVIVGHNSDLFDWPYVFNRAAHLGVALVLGRGPNPGPSFMLERKMSTNQAGTKFLGVYYVPGRAIMDSKRIVEDRCTWLDQYGLAHIADRLFGTPPPVYDPREDVAELAQQLTGELAQRTAGGLAQQHPGELAQRAAPQLAGGLAVPGLLPPVVQQSEDAKLDIAYSDLSNYFFRGTPQQKQYLFKYNMRDSQLVLRIMEHLKVMLTVTAECRVAGILLSDYVGKGKQVRIMRLLADMAHRFGYMIPDHFKVYHDDKTSSFVIPLYGPEPIKSKKYEGATVLEPVPGFYTDPVLACDMESLYPSIMRRHNVCPTRFVPSMARALAMGLREEDVLKTPVEDGKGVFVTVDKAGEGLLPLVLGILLTERKRIRQLLAKAKEAGDKALAAALDEWQKAVKVVANSIYGATGAPTGPIYCVDVAAAVTAIGRQTIMGIKAHVEGVFGLQVIYGDTDSVMFLLKPGAGPTPNEHLLQSRAAMQRVREGRAAISDVYEIGTELAALLNAAGIFHAPMRIAFECVYWPYFIRMKKKYGALKFTDPAKPPEKMEKGTASVKREYPPLVRRVFANLMHRLLVLKQHETAPELVLSAMRRAFQAILSGEVPLESVTKTSKLSKPVAEYGATKPPHVAAVMRWLKEEPGTAPGVGDRIPYVVVLGDPRSTRLCVAPPYAVGPGRETVDWSYYFDCLRTPVMEVLNMVFAGQPRFAHDLAALADERTYDRVGGRNRPNLFGQVQRICVKGRPIARAPDKRQMLMSDLFKQL